MTTVGYGYIAPLTAIGKFVSAVLMLIGYGIIAVPTGIISSEMTKSKKEDGCPACPEQAKDANFCSQCGRELS